MEIKKLLFCFLLVIFSKGLLLAQAPVISSFSPIIGGVGTLVTVTGTGLNNTTNLTIGGTAALIISRTATQVTGFIMPGATTGSIAVTTAGGTATSASDFTIVAGGYSPDKQQGNNLSTKTNTGQYLRQSSSVAISADGNTALAGNPNANGEVFVFIRTGTAWKQQGNKLEIDNGNSTFESLGTSLALSADGNTAVIGGPQTDTLKGAAFVFQRSNGVWTRVQPKLVGTGGAPGDAYQGRSVAISADGNTILSGGYNNNGKNAAWVFTKNGSQWQESAQLVAPFSGTHGPSREPVALSADGNTAAIGSLNGAWIFTRTSTGWLQQGDKLYGTGEQNPATVSMGSAIALSADGNTLLMGASADNNSLGAVWVFTRNNGVWTQQGSKLVSGASGTPDQFGFSVSLTADGNTALIGMPSYNENRGAVFVFKRTGETWARKEMLEGGVYVNEGDIQQVPDDRPYGQGYATAITPDGRTAIEGGVYDGLSDGFSWIFIDSTVPTGSPTPITFDKTASVAYGTADYPPAATSLNTTQPITFSSSDKTVATILRNQIHIIGAGTTVITASQVTDGYYPAYSTTQTLTVTKVPLTITANDQSMFAGDAVPALTLKYKGLVAGEDSTKLLFGLKVKTTATPASLPGTYPITASGATTGNYDITYVNGTLTVTYAVPTITSFSPASAIEGTIVTITGTHLDKVTGVSFGGTNALSFTANSPTTLSAVVAKGSSGNISVTAPGTTASLAGFTFVYTLPQNNFNLTTTGATCNGSANGSLKITAAQSQSYTATLTGNGLNTPYTFTTTKTINNLAAGTYSVCITLAGQPDYKQCYDVVITEPKNLSVYAEVNPNQDQLSLALSGGSNYTIKLNGTQYNTTESSINLPLSLGDNEVEVTTDKLCQGIFKKIFNIGTRVIPYPNPFQSALKLNLGNKNIKSVAVEIHDLADGRLVYVKQYANQSGILSLDLGILNHHVYSLKLTRDGQENIYKILKQQ